MQAIPFISDNLKQLIELYLPEYDFQPVIFKDSVKPDMIALWKFSPEIYSDCKATYRNDGIVSHLMPADIDMPIAFTTKSDRGVSSIVVHLAIAESIYRRGMLGVKFTRI